MRSVTTSIRLTPTLASRLQRAASRLSRGKNWIIAQALDAYLTRTGNNALANEARRQSLLASRRSKRRTASWETDVAGWK
jgi:predicted transcriptional regulator